jgi:hypothetical protein
MSTPPLVRMARRLAAILDAPAFGPESPKRRRRAADPPSGLFSCPQTAAAKLVLLALLRFANAEGVCWPGYAALAKRAGISRRQVIRIVALLEREGWITVLRRCPPYDKPNRDRTNVYTLHAPPLRVIQGAAAPPAAPPLVVVPARAKPPAPAPLVPVASTACDARWTDALAIYERVRAKRWPELAGVAYAGASMLGHEGRAQILQTAATLEQAAPERGCGLERLFVGFTRCAGRDGSFLIGQQHDLRWLPQYLDEAVRKAPRRLQQPEPAQNADERALMRAASGERRTLADPTLRAALRDAAHAKMLDGSASVSPPQLRAEPESSRALPSGASRRK